MLQNKGVYPGDPAMERIYSYKGPGGKKAFACFQDTRYDDTATSPYVREPTLLMDQCKITTEGKEWITAYKAKNHQGPQI